MRMVSVLNYETAGSQRDILKVWGDVVRETPSNKQDSKRHRALAQAALRVRGTGT